MNILAIDTSTKYLSIGVAIDGKVVFARDVYSHLKTASIIIPTISRILKKLKLGLNDFDCFSIGLGPGSFTGLRIGVSTIKAFSFCVKKKIIGISSLDVIAANVNSDGNICVISDARRNLLYAGFYKRKNGVLSRQGKIRLLTIDSVIGYYNCRGTISCAPTYFLGDGVNIYRDKISTLKEKNNIILDEAFWYPKAKNLCLLAKQAYIRKEFINIDELKPMYIYPKHCQVKR